VPAESKDAAREPPPQQQQLGGAQQHVADVGGAEGSDVEGCDDDATSAKSARSDLQAMYMAVGEGALVCC
jgi:hypothetical protein